MGTSVESSGAMRGVSGDAPDRQLAGFLAKYTPEVAAVATAALARTRKQLPGAVELVYDNYNVMKSASAKQRPRRPGV